jgi:hypothetical protein
MKVEKVEVSKGPVTFGIEVLSNGTKQFKDYDNVRLSAKTPFDVAMLDPEIRTPNDNLYLAHYLYQNVKFFNFMNLTLIALLCRKLTAMKYKIGEKIIVKGDTGDCMFIIYKGQVEVVREGHVGSKILIESGMLTTNICLMHVYRSYLWRNSSSE